MIDAFRRNTARVAEANRRQYDAPADPWEPIRVDPDTVERYTVVSLQWGLGVVEDADWDRPTHCTPVEEMHIHTGLRQRFAEGRDWTDTVYYEWASGQLDEHGRFRGVESEAALREDYLPTVDDFYESIRDDGYRPNYGTLYDSPDDANHIHDLEPMVLVGRDGEVIWTEGFHRLVLATIAGVDWIPVYVLRRHADWQAMRERFATTPTEERGATLERVADHPDVQDFA